jgi:hypothetical protein
LPRSSNTKGAGTQRSKNHEEDLSKHLVKAISAWKNSNTNASNAKNDLMAAKSLVEETKDAIKA